MLDQVTSTAAIAVARRVIPGLARDARTGLEEMVELVRVRLADSRPAATAIIRAQGRPFDDQRITELEQLIHAVYVSNPAFATVLEGLHKRYLAARALLAGTVPAHGHRRAAAALHVPRGAA